jgi:hypothetical protein
MIRTGFEGEAPILGPVLGKQMLRRWRDRSRGCVSMRAADAEFGITASVGSVTEGYDNAVVESFVFTLTNELADSHASAPATKPSSPLSNGSAGNDDHRVHSALVDYASAE